MKGGKTTRLPTDRTVYLAVKGEGKSRREIRKSLAFRRSRARYRAISPSTENWSRTENGKKDTGKRQGERRFTYLENGYASGGRTLERGGKAYDQRSSAAGKRKRGFIKLGVKSQTLLSGKIFAIFETSCAGQKRDQD